MSHYSEIDVAAEIAKRIIELDMMLDELRELGEEIIDITGAELILYAAAGWNIDLRTGVAERDGEVSA